MEFNSLQYFLFLIVITFLYYILKSVRLRNIVLLASSYYFYACWNAKLLVLIIGITLISYSTGLLIYKCSAKKIILGLSVGVCLTVLGVFKYYCFFAKEINEVICFFSKENVFQMPVLNIILPVGISFYTFQAVGYIVDVYRNKIEPEKNVLEYALYISFFPQLVAGPIERTDHILPQFKCLRSFEWKNLELGISLLIWGLFKKIVIADRIAMYVNTIYENVSDYSATLLVLATIGFALQIYCDFSAYSEMAMGSAKIFGIDLCENFDSPYMAFTLKGFWAKWHISLSSWFKDYLYIPLGGNRKGKLRMALNLLITFTLSGLWHGANWTYIIWGALHGIGQVIERFLIPISKMGKISKIFYRLCVMSWICFAWIFFRANSLGDAITVVKSIANIRNMGLHSSIGILKDLGYDVKYWIIVVIAVIVLLIMDIYKETKRKYWFIENCGKVGNIIFLLGLIFVMFVWGVYGPMYKASDFIYFQF